jgi:cytochrome P450/NADPH-cytochrome P450 reductase
MTTYALVNEVSDEKRFKKTIGASLNQVRNLVGDGLFTVRITVHYPVSGT